MNNIKETRLRNVHAGNAFLYNDKVYIATTEISTFVCLENGRVERLNEDIINVIPLNVSVEVNN